MKQPSVMSRRKWAERIRHRFADAVEAILDVGRYLRAAKHELPHGEFERMIVEDLGWNPSTARRLMLIASHPVLSKRAHVHALPPSWGTLYELTKLPTPTIERALRDGRITPELKRHDLHRLIKRAMPKSRTRACTITDLHRLASQEMLFGTIYADPPWEYKDSGRRGAAAHHYSTMSLEDIARLPIGKLAAPNAHLHLWTTNAFLFESKAIVEAWGFTYKSILVWVKPGRPGLGHYWRLAHEFLVLGVRGQCSFAVQNFPSWIATERRDHSTKPEIVRSMIEAVSPPPRLELFGRQPKTGWVVWGNEIDRRTLAQRPSCPR